MSWFSGLKSRLARRPAPVAAPPDLDLLEEIPRYPPFVKGLPAAAPSRIVATQQDMIVKIRGALPFNDVDFDRLVVPVIERYAAYVHLLPASQSHHHRGAGGLFRHGLEVGFYAAQKAAGTDFCVNNSPSDKASLEHRWMLAAFFGGLLHDVGKPITDVTVTTKEGSAIWNPYDQTLSAWCDQSCITNYYISWTERRNKKHERFSLTNLEMILTREVRSYLNVLGPSVMEAMLEAIAGSSVGEPLSKIVMWADQQSTGKDMRAQKLAIDPFHHHVPVEKFIFDALARIAQREKVNEVGGHIWVTTEGVYLAWKPVAEKIVKRLSDDNVPGIPRDPATLATILIDKGFAKPRSTKTGKVLTYWTIYPPVPEGAPSFYQNCLLIEDLDYVFAVEPQSRVTVKFNPDSDTESDSPPPTAPETAVTPPSQPATTVDVTPTPITNEDVQTMLGPDLSRQIDVFSASSSRYDDEDVPGVADTPVSSKAEKLSAVDADQESSAVTPGLLLIQKAVELQSGGQPILTQINKRTMAIEFPALARLLLDDTKELIRVLTSEELLIAEVGNKWVHDISGKKYLVLSASAHTYVQQQLSPPTPASPAASPDTDPVEPPPVPDAQSTMSPVTKLRPAVRQEESERAALLDKIMNDFIAQVIDQAGDLIVGEVEYYEMKNGRDVYRTSDGCLRKISQKYNVQDEIARLALSRHSGLKHKEPLIIITL